MIGEKWRHVDVVKDVARNLRRRLMSINDPYSFTSAVALLARAALDLGYAFALDYDSLFSHFFHA